MEEVLYLAMMLAERTQRPTRVHLVGKCKTSSGFALPQLRLAERVRADAHFSDPPRYGLAPRERYKFVGCCEEWMNPAYECDNCGNKWGRMPLHDDL